MLDQSMAEVGAYGDEIRFHFDEMYCVVYEVRFSGQTICRFFLNRELLCRYKEE